MLLLLSTGRATVARHAATAEATRRATESTRATEATLPRADATKSISEGPEGPRRDPPGGKLSWQFESC